MPPYGKRIHGYQNDLKRWIIRFANGTHTAMDTIGSFIVAERDRRALKQPGLIDLVALKGVTISQPRMSRIENGRVAPRVEEVVALLESLGVPEDEWPDLMRLPVRLEPTPEAA